LLKKQKKTKMVKKRKIIGCASSSGYIRGIPVQIFLTVSGKEIFCYEYKGVMIRKQTDNERLSGYTSPRFFPTEGPSGKFKNNSSVFPR